MASLRVVGSYLPIWLTEIALKLVRIMLKHKPPDIRRRQLKASTAVKRAISTFRLRGRYLVHRFLPLQVWRLKSEPPFLNRLWRMFRWDFVALVFAYFATLAVFYLATQSVIAQNDKATLRATERLEELIPLSQQVRYCVNKYPDLKKDKSDKLLEKCNKRQVEEERRKKEQERRIKEFLTSYRSPLAKDNEYIQSIITTEKVSGITDFAYFAVALAGTESTFGKNYPQGSFNMYGLCSPTPDKYCVFRNWDEAHSAIVKLLKRWNVARINEKEIWRICPLYSQCLGWGKNTVYFYSRIMEATI